MQTFIEKVRLIVSKAKPYTIPARYDNPTSFSVGDDLEDEAWEADMAEEPRIDELIDELPEGLDMDPSLLVKPTGTMNSPFMLGGSYPTIDTTTHLRFSTADDVSNACVFMLLAKTGFHKPGIQPADMAMIDRFPRRISRTTITGPAVSDGSARC